MSVTSEDVLHIAALARLGVAPERVPSLVAELNGILAHIDALSAAKTKGVVAVNAIGAPAQPLREDGGVAYPLERGLENVAPEMRDGFILVPRLATHETGEGA
jgi:aspartyl-tRNA(Asn)/glutamyl-tRNA(Gln) amidotransferase subunit C